MKRHSPYFVLIAVMSMPFSVAQDVTVTEALETLELRRQAFSAGMINDAPAIPPDLDAQKTEALPDLFQAFVGTSNPFTREWILRQFQLFDQVGVEYLLHDAPRDTLDKYSTLLLLLRRFAQSDSRVDEILYNALYHDAAEIRLQTVRFLRRPLDLQMTRRLAEMLLNETNLELSSACAGHLGHSPLGADIIIPSFLLALDDESRRERWELLISVLGRYNFHKDELIPQLLEVGEREGLRRAVVQALGQLEADTPAALAYIERGLYSTERYEPRNSIEVLQRIGPPAKPFIPRLIELLYEFRQENPAWRVGMRTYFADAMQAIAPDDPEVKRVLIETSLVDDPYAYMNVCHPDISRRAQMGWARIIDDFNEDGVDDLGLGDPTWFGSGGYGFELFLRVPERDTWTYAGGFFGYSYSIGRSHDGLTYFKSYHKGGSREGTWVYTQIGLGVNRQIWLDHGQWIETPEGNEWKSNGEPSLEVRSVLDGIEWRWNPYSSERCECIEGSSVWPNDQRHPP